MALVADAEGFNAHRRQYETIRIGKDRKVRRSPQAVACRKRDVQELGRPRRSCERDVSKGVVYSYLGTQGETRTQNDAGTVPLRRNARQAGGEVLATGTPAVCVWGVVSSIVLSGRESLPHGEGLDGSTPPGKEPHPGHVGPESDEPTSLRALAIRGSLETVTFCTEASATEEPDAGKLHVRVCTGDVG